MGKVSESAAIRIGAGQRNATFDLPEVRATRDPAGSGDPCNGDARHRILEPSQDAIANRESAGGELPLQRERRGGQEMKGERKGRSGREERNVFSRSLIIFAPKLFPSTRLFAIRSLGTGKDRKFN
jgi:hypothetical protein